MISTGIDFLIKLYTHKPPRLVAFYITPIHCNMSSRGSIHMILHYYPVQPHICKDYFKSMLLLYRASVDIVSILHPVFWVLVYLIFQSTIYADYYQSILLKTVLSSTRIKNYPGCGLRISEWQPSLSGQTECRTAPVDELGDV